MTLAQHIFAIPALVLLFLACVLYLAEVPGSDDREGPATFAVLLFVLTAIVEVARIGFHA